MGGGTLAIFNLERAVQIMNGTTGDERVVAPRVCRADIERAGANSGATQSFHR
jgi:hypothetical protein